MQSTGGHRVRFAACNAGWSAILRSLRNQTIVGPDLSWSSCCSWAPSDAAVRLMRRRSQRTAAPNSALRPSRRTLRRECSRFTVARLDPNLAHCGDSPTYHAVPRRTSTSYGRQDPNSGMHHIARNRPLLLAFFELLDSRPRRRSKPRPAAGAKPARKGRWCQRLRPARKAGDATCEGDASPRVGKEGPTADVPIAFPMAGPRAHPHGLSRAKARRSGDPASPLSLGMKWNGSNDNAVQTRTQNYGGDAQGAGAEVGLKLHF